MTTVLRLDKQALRSLFEEDPQFKLELQRAVISEVVKDVFRGDIVGDTGKLITELFAKEKLALVEAVKTDSGFRHELASRFDEFITRTRELWSHSSKQELSPALKGLIATHVTSLINEALRDQVGTVDARVKKATDELLEKVLERIGHVGGIVEHNWKVEALKQIREDVTKTISGLLA